MQSTYGIHWFRRDLRIQNNSALQRQWRRHEGRVLGFFCFDRTFLSRTDFSVNRFQFFIESLKHLQDDLRTVGSDLVCFDVGPQEAFSKLLLLLGKANMGQPQTISWSRDYEPFARARDKKMEAFLSEEKSIEVITERDHLIIEPNELLKDDGDFYKVYTPFSRKWIDVFKKQSFQERIPSTFKTLKEGVFKMKWHPSILQEDCLQKIASQNLKKVTVPIPSSGAEAAFKTLLNFKKKLPHYTDARDIPSAQGTSGLSFFLKNGSMTSAQIIGTLGLNKPDILKNEKDPTHPTSSARKYLNELIWREFYYHILFHKPEVESHAFIEKYRHIKWENNETYFQRWCDGLTGYPIVDAGMRQLKQTGWMHNRVRMIVASFLTKDLLIDWRWGERYFMQTLLDGDLAPNNGGWQWAASTGCDPQPYFRIFNPKLQSERFDPEGLYIKQFIPELKDVDAKNIHEPTGHVSASRYPRPIVNHMEQKEKALKLYTS